MLSMNFIPLQEELFKKSDHTPLEHSCPRCLPLSFLAVGQIGCCNIRIFVARTPYTQIPAMTADMPVKPFEAFPKESYISRKTHVALIAGGIGHAHMKVIKIWFPV